MRGAVVAAVAVVAILVGAGIGYLAGSANERTVTSVSTVTSFSTVTSVSTGEQALTTVSAPTPQNLSLTLSVNSTEFQPGEFVNISSNLTNLLPTSNNVTDEYRWAVEGLVAGSGCSSSEYPFGIGVFKGYYTSQNVSTGTPLDLVYPALTECPGLPAIVYYLFQPLSNVAFTGTLSEPPSAPTLRLQMNTTIAIDGYWTGYALPASSGLPPATFHTLDPGVYTVMAGDSWGNLVLLYFVVT